MRIITVYFLSVAILLSCSTKDSNFTPDAEVLLSIDIPSLLKDLAGRNARKNNFVNPFKEAIIDYRQDSTADFIDLFVEYHKQLVPNGQLTDLFKSLDATGMNNNMSNQEVIASLKEKRESTLDKSKVILESRLNGIEKLSNYSVNKLNNSLFVKLKGDVDVNQIKQTLTKKGLLEFWETYKNEEVGFMIYESANKVLSDSMYPGYRDSSDAQLLDSNLIDQSKIQPLSYLLAPAFDYEARQWWGLSSAIGYAQLSDSAKINEYLIYEFVISSIPKRDLFFMWEAKPAKDFKTADGEELLKLYLIKKTRSGEPLINSDNIKFAKQSFNDYNNTPMVNITFDSEGAILWSDMTENSYENQTGIAITMDNKVFSAPVASGRIDGGRTQISGNFTKQEAKELANIINSGPLPVPLTIQNIKITPQTPAK